MDIQFLGWCKNEKSDKVWGIVKKDDDLYVTFWGRRGAKLQKKMIEMDRWDAEALIRSKEKKGYAEVQKDDMEMVHDSLRKHVFKIGLSI
jgi:predicted DNA-binding WGR domain protein